VVLVSPADDLNGLTPRELEVLGLLVDGRSNGEIARALVVAQRTVAAHIEHILVKLVTPTRTLAAVRAERAGPYVPCVPGVARGEAR
jgi:DNA-binding NarL/FixJ family response regulator